MANEQAVNQSAAKARRGDPCVMVIFGASGDLTKRLLIPALYNLENANLLPGHFAILGFAVDELSRETFHAELTKDLAQFATTLFDQKTWEPLANNLYYMSGDFRDSASFHKLKQTLEQIDTEVGTPGNYLFYLAVAPSFFEPIVRQLAEAGLTKEVDGRWRRVIIEKPFGRDLDSARALNKEIANYLDESQTFRIDHYLGKETVQNILVFRFGNGIFEPIWNRRYIDNVQITAAETVGIELRGGYYDNAGALRDMVPNHLLTCLALTAMEPPNSFDSEAVRDEKAKVLHAIHPLKPEEVLTRAVRGQYRAGAVDGKHVPEYRAEPHVDPHSTTETYVALKLYIDNWRWAGVPFYLRTGKRMEQRVTEIAIQFNRPPLLLFRDTPVERVVPNLLVMHIQPHEAISLRFSAKIPGPAVKLGTVDMEMNYSEYFGGAPATGYETLLLDCMHGDQTLFQRADMVEAGWTIVDPILDTWRAIPPRDFPNYQSGSGGPSAADELLEKDGRAWWRQSDESPHPERGLPVTEAVGTDSRARRR